MSKAGSFTFVIYSHIPYVTSPDRFPQDINRLHEATAETFIPLLNTFSRLIEEGVSPKVTVGLTPLLTEMLTTDSFQEEFVSYLEERITAAERDLGEFEKLGKKHLTVLARMWREFYSFVLRDFIEKYDGNIVKAFAELEEAGEIEIITSGATHGYLPLLSTDGSIRAQLNQAVVSHKRHFGRTPRGVWLPEQAYRAGGSWQPPFDTGAGKGPCQRRGIEEFLGENGIEYLITDTHLLKGGEPLGVTMESSAASQGLWERYGGNRTTESNDLDRSPHTLYRLCNSEGNETPVALFTRDPLTNREVAGIDGGYPCDGNYLDFHRRQLPGNLRYWKVTGQEGDLVDRDEYHPDAAFSSIAEQADHFAQLVKETLTAQREQSSEEGILVALFNARLFGQRWFEGPEWLYHTITSLAQDGEVEMVTAGEYLKRKSPSEGVTISEGSWGGRGNHRPWCNESNEWIWRRIYEAEEEMVALVKEYGGIENNLNLNKTLRQAGRELLLLQSSDWQLLVNTPSDRAFAEMRVVRHFEDFKRLAEIARHVGREGALRKNDWAFLQLCMERDEIFPDIEPLWFSGMRLKETVL